jgi:trans-2,3-dihydro-3-hydroxyanthranilate isomerase
MTDYAFETYDVFTNEPFAGNQLAVVMDARGLSGERMQAIAREFNLSETSFVLPPESGAHTARVRIFTPMIEMPFAGHPTVGTAVAIAKARGISGEVLLELAAGLFPVAVRLSDRGGFAEFNNPNLPEEKGDAPDAAALEAALSLPQGAVDRSAHRPRRIGAGVDFIYAKAPLDAVRRAGVDSAAWKALAMDSVIGVYLYANDAAGADYHARMFAPGAGVAEDPATGSAAAALPGQIALSEKLTDGEHHWRIEQGVEMGRPSRIEARVAIRQGAVASVRIGGGAVKVQAGVLTL